MQCGLGERKNIIPFSEGTNQWLKGLSYIKYNSVFSLIIQEEKKKNVCLSNIKNKAFSKFDE